MKKIFALVDYKGVFGSKHFDSPYRSGFDKKMLTKYFIERSYDLEFIPFNSLDFKNKSYRNEIFIYTSSEDEEYHYKSFIEDIVLCLELAGAKVIPEFKYLRANNNKVFMELLRDISESPYTRSLPAEYFGTKEEFNKNSRNLMEPFVVKKAEGASGTGVFLSKDKKSSNKIISKVSKSNQLLPEWWDFGRSLKHKGYIRESKYRRKFVVQKFVPNLKNDWKIYIFGKRLYVFYRPIFKHRGIKASGGGYDNYFYGSNALVPEGLFDFAYQIFQSLKVPHASLDIGYDGNQFYLFEFQCLYFGTAGIPYSREYFTKTGNSWINVKENLDQEKVYADSIIDFISHE